MQHARPPCPALSPKVCPSSRPLRWWCHPIISSSVTLFSFVFNLSQHQDLFQWVHCWLQVKSNERFNSKVNVWACPPCVWPIWVPNRERLAWILNFSLGQLKTAGQVKSQLAFLWCHLSIAGIFPTCSKHASLWWVLIASLFPSEQCEHGSLCTLAFSIHSVPSAQAFGTEPSCHPLPSSYRHEVSHGLISIIETRREYIIASDVRQALTTPQAVLNTLREQTHFMLSASLWGQASIRLAWDGGDGEVGVLMPPQQPSTWFFRGSLEALAHFQTCPELMPTQLPSLMPSLMLNSSWPHDGQNLTGSLRQKGGQWVLGLCPYGVGENLGGNELLNVNTRGPEFWGPAVISTVQWGNWGTRGQLTCFVQHCSAHEGHSRCSQPPQLCNLSANWHLSQLCGKGISGPPWLTLRAADEGDSRDQRLWLSPWEGPGVVLEVTQREELDHVLLPSGLILQKEAGPRSSRRCVWVRRVLGMSPSSSWGESQGVSSRDLLAGEGGGCVVKVPEKSMKAAKRKLVFEHLPWWKTMDSTGWLRRQPQVSS